MGDTLKGRRALITGAGAGQGRAVARLFAAQGCDLALCDIDPGGLEETAASLCAQEARVFTKVVDVARISEIEACVAEAGRSLGGIDILYNNAGISVTCSMDAVDEALWDRIHAINLKAYFFAARAALPFLRRSNAATIINVGSMAGHTGLAGLSAYCASKGGVHQLTKALAVELAPDAIRVNCIAPGLVETEMVTASLAGLPAPERAATIAGWAGRQLFKRAGDPAEIAAIALFLASDQASFLTGEIVHAAGGWAAA